jgi:hypothetical protein
MPALPPDDRITYCPAGYAQGVTASQPLARGGTIPSIPVTISQRTPEQSLWVAVVLQMVLDARNLKKTHDAKVLRAAALEWIFNSNREFYTVCELAGFNPERVREDVIKAQARGFAWRRPAGTCPRYEQRKRSRKTVTL